MRQRKAPGARIAPGARTQLKSPEELSPRELECLHWAALGKDYKDIAMILEISEHTTRSYLKSARVKLGCAMIRRRQPRRSNFHLISV